MTPQDIREKTFEKAMFGGYDMAAVQNYQEEVAAELANAQKEIAVLKGKMKVLVDKIEEYRASEDAMRLAILSAQKVGKQIEDDAKASADKILSEAKSTSDRILGGLQHETANEEAKLLAAKTSCAKFLEDVRNLCMNQLEYLDKIAGSKAVAAQPAAQPASVSAAPAEPVSEPKIIICISRLVDSVAVLFSIVVAVTVMFIIVVTILINAGNSAVMFG